MANCTNIAYRFYNGGWSSWSTYLQGGQVGAGGVMPVIRFTTPKLTGYDVYTSKQVTITVPWRATGSYVSFTLYAKLHTSDPTGGSFTIPKSSYNDTSVYCNRPNNMDVYTASITLYGLADNTTYYVSFGASTKHSYPDLGYNGYWSFNYTGSGWNYGGKPTLTIKDNGNNTFTLSGKLGSNGANNALQSSALYYTLDGHQPAAGSPNTTVVSLGKTSDGAFTKTFNIPPDCEKIIATVWCVFTYGSTQNSGGHIELPVKYYAAPSKPGIPVIKYTKNRLTVKENWTYTWTAAKEANDNSPIKGYRIRLYKNGVSVPIYNIDGKEISEYDSAMVANTKYYYDTKNSSCTFSIDPVQHGFLPGDKVKLGIYAYTRNGKSTQLFSGGGYAEVFSNELVVQNAGIMRVKVDGTWREGQVWVKADGKWHEADIVKTKVNGTWVESE